MTVSCGADFDVKSPEGGCTLVCTAMLDCGHPCNTRCHSQNRNHVNKKCFHDCEKICDNLLHICKKRCYQDCGQCIVRVLKELPCGHQATMPCHQDPGQFRCKVEVEKTFTACKHTATVQCYVDPAKEQCPKICENRLECGHSCELKCHVKEDPEHINYKCNKPCPRFNLNCSLELHECGKLCHEKCNPCKVLVVKTRTTCNHRVKLECSADPDVIFCKEKCKRSLTCGHFCKEKCGDPCLCHVKVNKQIATCGHEVRVECHVEATRKMCLKECKDMLPCGHPCGNLCCQPCSSKCDAEAGMTPGACGHLVPLACWEKQAGMKLLSI